MRRRITININVTISPRMEEALERLVNGLIGVKNGEAKEAKAWSYGEEEEAEAGGSPEPPPWAA
jgi:hypothetical protein